MEYINSKLEEFNRYVKDKKVAVLGLNINKIPLIEYLNKNGAEVTIFDDREIDDIDKNALNIVVSHGMKFYFGKNNLNNLKGFNLIFRMPSLLPTKLELVEEKERGAIITTEAEMILELCPGLTIGVTGSYGKTAICTLIYKILKNKGYGCYFSGDSEKSLFSEYSI